MHFKTGKNWTTFSLLSWMIHTKIKSHMRVCGFCGVNNPPPPTTEILDLSKAFLAFRTPRLILVSKTLYFGYLVSH